MARRSKGRNSVGTNARVPAKEAPNTSRVTRSSTRLRETSRAVHVTESLTTPQRPAHDTRVTRSSVKFTKSAEITLGTVNSTSPLTADPSTGPSQPDGLPLPSKPCFFELPPEIRVEIYTIIAQATVARVLTENNRIRLARPWLTRISRQFCKEFMTEFWTSAAIFEIQVKDFDFSRVHAFAAKLLKHNLKRLPSTRKDSQPEPRELVISLDLTQTQGPDGTDFQCVQIISNFSSMKKWIKYMSKHQLGQGSQARDIDTKYVMSSSLAMNPDMIESMDGLQESLHEEFVESLFLAEEGIKQMEARKILHVEACKILLAVGEWIEECAMMLDSDSDSHVCICGECYPESDFSE